MTFKELKKKLEKLSPKQLNQEIKIISVGYDGNYPISYEEEKGVFMNPLSLEIAEFDLYHLQEEHNEGVPDMSIEDADLPEDYDVITMLGVKEGMPYIRVSEW